MANVDFSTIWNTLSKIDCSGHTEQKKTGKDELTYLSWTWAWAELMKRYPQATYRIREWDGRPWLDDPVAGVMVMTEVEISGNVRTMWLAAMDGANHALKRDAYTYTVKGWDGKQVEKTVAAVDMCAINKALMRCLVKNLAMFGLGLNIYAGEDLPVGVDEDASVSGTESSANSTEKKAEAPKVAPQKPIRTTIKVDQAAAPKRPSSGRAKLFQQAWGAFLNLKSVSSMDDDSRKRFFKGMLKQVVGNDDPHTLTPEEWGRVIAHVDMIGKEVVA